MKAYVFYHGRIVNENEVAISIRCAAFNYGLGCFEGIRAFWNEKNEQLYVFRLQDHYKRLLRSCKTLNINIPYTVRDLSNWTVDLLKKNGFKTTVYIRPIAFKGADGINFDLSDNDNRLLIYCLPLAQFVGEEALSVAVSSWTRVSNNMIPPRAKPTAAYLNSALASLEASQNGYDGTIFLNHNGYVSEGPGENIFIVRNGVLITPSQSDDILEGITMDTVMVLAKKELGIPVVRRSITRAELYSADEVFFTGTYIGIKPIVEIDKRKIGTGQEGSVCKSIKKLYNSLVLGNNLKYAYFCTPVY